MVAIVGSHGGHVVVQRVVLRDARVSEVTMLAIRKLGWTLLILVIGLLMGSDGG